MLRRAWLTVLLMALGCGGTTEDLANGGGGAGGAGDDASALPDGANPAPGCGAYGASCVDNAACCSGTCDAQTHTCTSTLQNPAPAGGGCTAATDCATMSCVGGQCSTTACVSDAQPCTSDAACCSGTCTSGACAKLNPGGSCKTAGNACAASTECCSTLCDGGFCKLAASFCIQTGDACVNASDCCGGVCVIAAGAKLGVCSRPSGGGTYCTGLDGEACGGCGDCCSRLCAPFGPTGVNVCQPASGCRVNGDLCRQDGDCCGAAGTGLPGDGNVTCEKDTGAAIGICLNPRGCNPEANVCHFKQYVCEHSSARNDCCGATGNSGVCQLDTIGVPRCYGLGKCREPGETCAMASDCCNALPCIPDSAGALHCAVPPDGGGPGCSQQGGPCTISADCCPGSLCITQAGSTHGVCGVYTPPVPPPGGDSGPPSDAAAPPPSDGGILYCSLYGQSCTVAADCCSGVDCTNSSGLPCGSADTGCACYTPIK